MNHAYYLSKDLDDMEALHDELLEAGIDDSHIHVLSDADAEVTSHHIRAVNPFMKTNVLRFLAYGLGIGIALFAAMLSIPLIFYKDIAVGIMPFAFAAMIFLGLATWEGGFLGFQSANQKFGKVFEDIHQGKHLLIVDYNESKASTVTEMVHAHPSMRPVYL